MFRDSLDGAAAIRAFIGTNPENATISGEFSAIVCANTRKRLELLFERFVYHPTPAGQ
jgi:hypothetical protein